MEGQKIRSKLPEMVRKLVEQIFGFLTPPPLIMRDQKKILVRNEKSKVVPAASNGEKIGQK